jgi:hypothetical protein
MYWYRSQMKWDRTSSVHAPLPRLDPLPSVLPLVLVGVSVLHFRVNVHPIALDSLC